MSTRPSFSLIGRIARISRPKLHNMPGEHEGILLPDGRVAHTCAGRHPEIVSFADFAQGMQVRLLAELDASHTADALARLNSLLRKRLPYDFLFGNCESFARRVMGEPGVSWQIVGAVTFAWGIFKIMQS